MKSASMTGIFAPAKTPAAIINRLNQEIVRVLNLPSTKEKFLNLFALTNVTLPFALKLANKGFAGAINQDPHLKRGVNTHKGKVVYEAVAHDQGLDYTPISEIL